MTTDFSYNASDDMNIKSRSQGKIEKGLKRLMVIAAVVFSAELIWLFGVTPFIPFSTIEVQTIAGLNRQDVLLLAGIDSGASFVSTNAKEARNRLAGNILVESAVVIKRFPDKLSIFLNPRVAAAVAIANTDSRQRPLYVDRNGIFFKYAGELTPDAPRYPVLSGFENPSLNKRLPAALVPLCENLSAIASSSPELLTAISEIRVERKEWDNYDLVLYPVHSSIRVRLENNLTEDALRYTLLMLNVFEDNPEKPREIDFRSGMGSYRTRSAFYE